MPPPATTTVGVSLSPWEKPLFYYGVIGLFFFSIVMTHYEQKSLGKELKRKAPFSFGTRPSSLTTNNVPKSCPSLRYARLTCPLWNPDIAGGGVGVDYRVRWIFNHQHVQDREKSCRTVNYLFREFHPRIGFGANVFMVLVSGLYVALYSNRILLPEPEITFPYSNCTEQNWECYFEPLSRCTVNDTNEILATDGGVYGSQHLNASHRILRGKKVKMQKKAREKLIFP
jgi:hypothetical protein